MMSPFPIRRNRKRAGRFVPLALPLCMLLAYATGGCEEEPAPSRPATKMVVPVKPKSAAPQTLPEAAGPEPTERTQSQEPSAGGGQEISSYRPKAKRDPFMSFITTTTPVQMKPEMAKKIRTPLQRYSLDQLKVVGIIAGGNVRKALVEDDVGKGYVVSVGDEVGSEGGEIAVIKEDRIIVQSTYRDLMGNKKVRRITKKLYTSEEGDNP